MSDVPARVVRRALVRSRIKVRVLAALLHLGGDAYLPDLAREARTSEQWVRAAAFGDGRSYRVASSLHALGLVAFRRDAFGPFLALTPKGRATARAWTRETVQALRGGRRRAFA